MAAFDRCIGHLPVALPKLQSSWEAGVLIVMAEAGDGKRVSFSLWSLWEAFGTISWELLLLQEHSMRAP